MKTKAKIKNNKFKNPKALIMSGYGLNCEEETKFAFEKAGGQANIIHINDLIKEPTLFLKYNILVFPGGFSYGDDTGSGKAYANKIKNHLRKELEEFVNRDTLVIGICNGFQIITNLGLLPGGLAHNEGGQYIDRWVDLKVQGNLSAQAGSPWLGKIKNISLPIAHGEGRYVISEKEYKNMCKNKEIAFVYEKGEMFKFQNLKANPNGAMHDIAGVLGYNGRVLGLMPHPERAMFFNQMPNWQIKKEILLRKKKNIPADGPGLILFKNAVDYFKK
jgi:phosphoribosylformylglycinamidine synthase subunit PurQ / glutaminase